MAISTFLILTQNTGTPPANLCVLENYALTSEGEKLMGKSVKNPKKHIVSCRVNEGEMETLQHLTEESGISISDLLRQSLLQLCDQPHGNTQQAA
jgi:hypothetical protein